MLSTFSAAQ